jgi:hypothetical protein
MEYFLIIKKNFTSGFIRTHANTRQIQLIIAEAMETQLKDKDGISREKLRNQSGWEAGILTPLFL